MRRDFLEHSEPFSSDCVLKRKYTSEICARPSQVCYQTRANWVRNRHENNRDSPGRALYSKSSRSCACQDHIGLQSNQFFRTYMRLLRSSNANVNLSIAALRPSCKFKSALKGYEILF